MGLDVGQTHIDFRVLELVVLVEAALRPVGLAADLHRTFVIALNLIRIPPQTLELVISAFALAELLILRRLDGTSYFLSLAASSFLSSISCFIWEVRAMLASSSRQYSW